MLIAALILWNIWLFWPQGQPSSTRIPYSTFLAEVRAGNVRQVSITGPEIKGAFVQAVAGPVLAGTPTAAPPAQATPAPVTTFANFETTFPDAVGDPTLMPLLAERQVVVNVSTPSTPWFLVLLTNAFPFLLLLGALAWMGRSAARSQAGVFNFGRSQARRYTQDRPGVTFNDVAGADEAKQNLAEVVDFLLHPDKYHKLGARSRVARCWSARRAPARPCWPGPWPARPTCPSSASAARSSCRCSSASAPAACAISSSRPKKPPPPSSSLMRWTRWAASAAPASRRQRRARADAQPDAGRDGRL